MQDDIFEETKRSVSIKDVVERYIGLIVIYTIKHAVLLNAKLLWVNPQSVTNITMQLIAGVDIKTVSVRAGHAKASTTSDFYSHFIKNSDIHASEVINKMFE